MIATCMAQIWDFVAGCRVAHSSAPPILGFRFLCKSTAGQLRLDPWDETIASQGSVGTNAAFPQTVIALHTYAFANQWGRCFENLFQGHLGGAR